MRAQSKDSAEERIVLRGPRVPILRWLFGSYLDAYLAELRLIRDALERISPPTFKDPRRIVYEPKAKQSER